MPYNTDSQHIIDVLRKYYFIATHAAMLKSHKTGKPGLLYMVNVLSKKIVYEIYSIN